ncbi:MAG: helix-turn-helix domain-containing protein, partial [Syntrophorhabdaceae bacterium]|nr:helix-turn-helix domain-containing protein [Syntrophorhabdaceae bacterium]
RSISAFAGISGIDIRPGIRSSMNIDEQYLTVRELSEKIKYSHQTIYNMIHDGRFVRSEHYIKPSRKKVLFLWSAVRRWMESIEGSGDAIEISANSRQR